MDEPIQAGAPEYAMVQCPLPGCGELLHIVWTVDHPLYVSDTAADLAEPGGDSTWEVQCEAGHIVLVPIDNAADNHHFGRCTCEPGDPGDRWCEHSDMDRLRALLTFGGAS